MGIEHTTKVIVTPFHSRLTQMKISFILSVLFSITVVNPVFGEQLRELESQLNVDSITGVVQNPYSYTVGSMTVRAEFYDKDDCHLVSEEFWSCHWRGLKPLEKSSFKIYEEAGETGEFPKTDFIVKVEGDDHTNVEEVSLEEHIEEINNITKQLETIRSPKEEK